jgi:cysteate synthase
VTDDALSRHSRGSTVRVRQRCADCGLVGDGHDHQLYCSQCGRAALVVNEYLEPLTLAGDVRHFASYAAWLPYRNVLGIPGPQMACIRADALGGAVGVSDLWVAVSGYSPRLGSAFLTGTFKECEAIGVLNRVREQTDKILVVSSAGNAGRAFLELGASYNEPAIVVLPERAMPNITRAELPDRAPLLVLIRDAYYPDAIRLVDRAIERFPGALVREGGCYNTARRDSMGVPFLRAVQAMGGLPDRYVQAVGSGTGAIAAWEAAQRLQAFGLVSKQPMRMLLVQNSPFTPMVDAWRDGKRDVAPMSEAIVREKLAQSYARVLSNANPPYAVRGGVHDVLVASGGTMCAVANDEIVAAQKLAADLLGFEPCDAAAAALAGLIRSIRGGVVGRDERVLLHLTGGGLGELARDYGGFPYPRAVTVDLHDDGPVFSAIQTYLARLGPIVRAKDGA